MIDFGNILAGLSCLGASIIKFTVDSNQAAGIGFGIASFWIILHARHVWSDKNKDRSSVGDC